MDIAPTLLEITDSKANEGMSWRNLLPFLLNEQPLSWRDVMYTQCNGTEIYYTSRMAKTKSYKFVYNPTDMDELYDLRQAPHELVNIADQPAMASMIKKMYRKMWENAFKYEDNCFVRYLPVTTAQYGPGIVNEIP